jgi:hypothetical protein
MRFVSPQASRRESASRAIQERNERGVGTRPALKVLSYVPETRDLTFLSPGWAVEWRTFSASIVESPGGEAKQIGGTVLEEAPGRQLEGLPRNGDVKSAAGSRRSGMGKVGVTRVTHEDR